MINELIITVFVPLQCADLDECRSRPCGTGARCTNQIGGYTCECLSGRTGDPYNPKGCTANQPQGKI